MKNPQFSRLAKKQEVKNIRRAILFGLMTLILVFSLLFLGLPFLIKIAVFFGNLKSSYVPTEQQDNIAPPAPAIIPPPEATFSAQIDISGITEPGSVVEIFLSGISEQKTVVETDGTFLVSNLNLTEGRNEITAIATDKAGNISLPSEKTVVILDNTPPTLSILEPQNNSTFYGTQKKIVIKGETEAEAKILVNDRLVIVDSQGKFSYPFTLSEGENKIKIVAEDRAGNKTEQEITVRLE